MSRYLNFQIQEIRSSEAVTKIELLLHSLNAQQTSKLGAVSVDFCIAENYCNVVLESKSPVKFWKRFTTFVAENSNEFDWLKKRWIVVLQGENGWDDYLLLAHFNLAVTLDSLASKKDSFA